MVTIQSPGRLMAREFGDAILNVLDRAHRPERGKHALQAFAVHMGVAVDQARHDRLSFEIDHSRSGSDMGANVCAARPTAKILSPAIAIASAIENAASTVMTLALVRTMSAERFIASDRNRVGFAPVVGDRNQTSAGHPLDAFRGAEERRTFGAASYADAQFA